MPTLLHVDSSARTTTSVSRALTAGFVAAWEAAHPSGVVVRRDVASECVPLVTEDWVTASSCSPTTHSGSQRLALARSEALVDELLAADVLVIGAPVYNLGVPAGLKAWIDQVARAGRTFAYGPHGPQGLLTGKRAVVVCTSGTDPQVLAGLGMEHCASYLRSVLGFLGITDVEVVHAWGTSPDVVDQTAAAARDRLRDVAEVPAALAA